MSALGQKQTYAVQQCMSALAPIATTKADIAAAPRGLPIPVLALGLNGRTRWDANPTCAEAKVDADAIAVRFLIPGMEKQK